MTPSELLSRFKGKRVLVLGDLMLDEYIFGRATRISQEAPVMVVRQTSTRAVPGGAANVAANIQAMGGEASILGVVGDDVSGTKLANALQGVSVARLVVEPGRPTTTKLRVLANHAHQVLRIDHEEEGPIAPETEEALMKALPDLLQDVQVLLISDYQKGCATDRVILESIAHARQAGVPVVANPKPKSLGSYEGSALVSLNRYEAGDALGNRAGVDDSDAEEAARTLRDRLGVERVLVTLGGSGLAAAGAHSYRVPAVKVDVYDEAGAGDTVIATIALGIASGSFGRELLELATRTAAAVVQKVGVAVPTQQDLDSIASLGA